MSLWLVLADALNAALGRLGNASECIPERLRGGYHVVIPSKHQVSAQAHDA